MNFLSETPQRLFGSIERAPMEGSENQKNFKEISFGEEEYRQVWRELLEEVGDKNFFNGRVTSLHEGFTSTLRTTLIIYRDRHNPEGPIEDIVPIWWEIETITDEGDNLPNDFTLHELLKLVGKETES